MYYDDVDVNILDAKDTFGIMDTTATMSLSTRNSSSKTCGKLSFHKTPLKREYCDAAVASDSKIQSSKLAKKSKSAAAADLELYAVVSSEGGSSEKKLTAEGRTSPMVTPTPVVIDQQPSGIEDFKYRPAVTFQEKLSVLEERDRRLRETVFRGASKNMNVIAVGTCPDMCPEKERLLREIHCSFSMFEGQIVQNEMHVVPELLVKEYARSSADQDEPLPHELRPEPVLMDTMSHILANIVPRIEDNSVDVGVWYHFCWDRLRSLRKDIVQQQLRSTNIVNILEQSARFHICCADRLFGADRRVFDEKINAENLVNCLQMLVTMYEDLEARGQWCQNESEFRVYMMLLQLDSGDLPDVLRWHDENGRRQCDEAKRIFFAFKTKLYTRFFKLVKKAEYLTTCVLQRYFATIRTHILNVLVNSYSSGSQTAKFPLSFARNVLEFDNNQEMAAFVQSHGFVVNYAANEIRGSKSTFVLPEHKPASKKSSWILASKRVPMLEAITKTRHFTATSKLSKVHSSFDENDVLRAAAWNAQDQREKVIQLYGNVYKTAATMAIADQLDGDGSPAIATIKRFDYQLEEYLPLFPAFVPVSKQHIVPPVSVPSKFTAGAAATQLLPPQLPPSSVFDFGTYHTLAKREHQPEMKSEVWSGDNEGGTFHTPETAVEPVSTFSFASVPVKVMPKSVESSIKSDLLVATLPLSVVSSSSQPFSNLWTIEPPILFPMKTTAENVLAELPPQPPLTPPLSPQTLLQHCEPNPPPIASIRKANEVANSLANALSQFEQLYWNHLGITKNDQVELQHYNEQLENRALHKVIKRRLKRKNAKKVARLWRKKVEMRRQKRDNFVGIVHLSPDEYLRLWGRVHPGVASTDKSCDIVEDVTRAHETLSWSSSMLNAKSLAVKYVGAKLADVVACCMRAQCAKLRLKMSPIICWKVLVSLPQSRDPSSRSFEAKIRELCRALYYADEQSKLGDVRTTYSGDVRVLTAVNVVAGSVASWADTVGVSSLIVYAGPGCHWETTDELIKRVSTICTQLTCRLFVSVIVTTGANACGDEFLADVRRCLSGLRNDQIIGDYSVTKWSNLFTVPKVIFAACQHVPVVPPFTVKSLASFVDAASGDFFANLFYMWDNNGADNVNSRVFNSPIVYIKLYNQFVAKLQDRLAREDVQQYNLAPDFLPYIAGGEQLRNNLTDNEVVSMVARYSLVSFTKWPPKSMRKMITLLTKYCTALDADGILLPNVLRLVNPRQGVPVQQISREAPWLKIVELWVKFNAHYVSKNEDAEKLLVFYNENKIKEITECLWVSTAAATAAAISHATTVQ